MARLARQLSKTGIYHIVFRGVNHCHLFEASDDFEKMLEMLASIKAGLAFEVFSYVLMSNHVHLLIKENTPGDVSTIMKKLLGPYAVWFNRKYQRSGALIANRYKSECVEDEGYLLTLVRYIHQNPLEAGAVIRPEDYQWSSYNDYIDGRGSLVDTAFVLGVLPDKPSKAVEELVAFQSISEEKDFSLPDSRKPSEEEVYRSICAALDGREPNTLVSLPKPERNAILASLRRQGFSIRQIERTTGISRGIIEKARPT
jgi:REP element-mobilizing transposase RayT